MLLDPQCVVRHACSQERWRISPRMHAQITCASRIVQCRTPGFLSSEPPFGARQTVRRVAGLKDPLNPIARLAYAQYTCPMDVLQKLRKNGIPVDIERIAAIAEAYSVKEISVFGSSLRDDMTGESDIDLLVTFKEGAAVSLFDLMGLEEKLSQLFGRPVDIVEPDSLTNPIRRRAILSTKQRLYAAA